MNWKKILLALGGLLGITAGVLTVVPAAAPFAPIVKTAGVELSKHAEAMRDDCSDRTCQRDPKTGEAGVRGQIQLLDGGTCECR